MLAACEIFCFQSAFANVCISLWPSLRSTLRLRVLSHRWCFKADAAAAARRLIRLAAAVCVCVLEAGGGSSAQPRNSKSSLVEL